MKISIEVLPIKRLMFLVAVTRCFITLGVLCFIGQIVLCYSLTSSMPTIYNTTMEKKAKERITLLSAASG